MASNYSYYELSFMPATRATVTSVSRLTLSRTLSPERQLKSLGTFPRAFTYENPHHRPTPLPLPSQLAFSRLQPRIQQTLDVPALF